MSQQPPQRFIAGAVDLGEVKLQAESRAKAATEGVSPVFTVTQSTVTDEVVERSYQVPVVVAVGSSRAPECAQLNDEVTALASAQSSVQWVYGYLDADVDPRLAQALGVQAIPTVMAFAAGQPIADFQGAQPADAIRRWIQSVVDATRGRLAGLPSAPEDEAGIEALVQRSVAALDAGDPAQCLAVLDSAGDVADSDARIPRLRRRAEWAAEVLTRAADAIIGATDRGSGTVEAQCTIADAEVANGHVEQGFDRLLGEIRANAGETREIARRALLSLFEFFDPTDERVSSARSQLAAALY